MPHPPTYQGASRPADSPPCCCVAKPILAALVVLVLLAPCALNASESADEGKTPTPAPQGEVPIEDPAIGQLLEALASAPYAPVMTEPGHRAYLFSIPAPRGLILDRHGFPLARNRTARYLALRLSQINALDENSVVELVEAALDANPSLADLLIRPSATRIRQQWKHRRGLPLAISAPLTEELETELEHSMGPAFSLETVYLRDYPEASTACHIVGHVSREAPQLSGPVVRGESLWPAVRGRSGIEEMYDELLSGSAGLLSELYDEDGTLLSRKILRTPRAGLTFVVTIDLEMQKLAEAILAQKGRPGAMVAVDADSGEILSMASYPTFNPADFVPSMSKEKYRALTEDPANPFFPRATQAVYPPGSTFKPFVALAALEHGTITALSLVSGPTSLQIAGRTFRNWSSKHQGMLNVQDAIARSSNTWFYQVGIKTGGEALRENIQRFGFGRTPDIPIDGTSAGVLPDAPRGQQATANFSIGQGEILVSPLQMAIATAGIANGERVPWPQLVLQTQTPAPDEKIIGKRSGSRGEPMNFRQGDLNLVRSGMWRAVNGKSGTGGAAHVAWPEVSGKTGTAQWHARSVKRNVAWFTGFVNAEQPRIAIAVAIEGKLHVTTGGGKHAAPLAGKFLNEVYDNPTRFAVNVPSKLNRPAVLSSSNHSGRSMVQISPRRDGLAVTQANPAPPASQTAPAPRLTSTAARASLARSKPQPSSPPRKQGGFLSRLRSLFPSSN